MCVCVNVGVCVYVHDSEGVRSKCINNSTTLGTTHYSKKRERDTKYESITVCV